MSKCIDRPCCWHETQRYTTRAAGGLTVSGTMVKTERCCYCGEYQNLHFLLGENTEHGPHAPAVWRQA